MSKSRNKSETKISKSKPTKPSSKSTKVDELYFDNNSHTFICAKAQEAFIRWSKYYNPSGDSKSAKEARDVIDKALKFMHEQCGTSPDTHKIIFTSGASESNSTILRSTAYAMRNLPSKLMKPYIIASAIEHHNIMQTLEDLKKEGICEVSYIKPNMYGQIKPGDVEHEIETIKSNGGVVILITIMFANNETGSINNVPKIAKIAEQHQIPLHTDAVQVFGKFSLNLGKNNIAAMSASFHKLYGPGGIGLLVIEQSLIDGYKLGSLIGGTQQSGLRGGTENVPAIAAAMEATIWTLHNRESKNEKLYQMKNRILDKLKKHYPFGNLLDYILDNGSEETADPRMIDSKDVDVDEIKLNGSKVGGKLDTAEIPKKPIELVVIGPPADRKNSVLPNTILLAVAKNKGESFCNILFKQALMKRGVIVSISSACLTSSPKASHVLTAMDLPSVLKKGVIRISLGDDNTPDECDKFVEIFLEVLDNMLKHMDKASKVPSIDM
jgi:cysteine desulfurase